PLFLTLSLRDALPIFSVFFALYGRQISDPLIAGVQPGSPAAEAGFEAGDRFISVEGEKITTFSDVQRIVSGRAGDKLNFTVEREDRKSTRLNSSHVKI